METSSAGCLPELGPRVSVRLALGACPCRAEAAVCLPGPEGLDSEQERRTHPRRQRRLFRNCGKPGQECLGGEDFQEFG